jgi:ribosome-associated toxin RatA of RatAB toxin-antitoxin module
MLRSGAGDYPFESPYFGGTLFAMAVRVEVPYHRVFHTKRNLSDTYAYFSDLEKSVPANFPGVEGFETVSKDTFRWVFEKVGYSGYEVQIKLITKFSYTPEKRIDVAPIAEPGACLFTGSWQFEPKGTGTQVEFTVTFVMELPIPGFLKGMAVPLAQKEMTKLFDRYIARVEKNFP